MPELLRPSPPPTLRDRIELVIGAVRSAPGVSAIAAAAVVAAGVLAFLVVHRSGPPPELRLPRAAPAPAPPATAGDAVAHVAGAVTHPGIVKLPPGARVADALAAAGGPRGDADLDQLNLAAKVGDGDRVYVPKRGETPPPGPSSASGSSAGVGSAAKSGPIDLNSATPEQLDGLPGVGPAIAKAIVEYRSRHGRFRTVDDLLSVPGIGPAKLATLKPLVRT